MKFEMEHIDNGMAAFPCPEDESNLRTKGMTLRDYFAAKWMHGFVASCVTVEQKEGLEAINGIAMCAYDMADAMLRARGTP